MPRTARASVGGVCYHVLNRGNRRDRVFHTSADYDTFIDLIDGAQRRLPLQLLAYCVMPNHFHLVARPQADGDLSRWMQWLLTTHVRRHHRAYQTDGRIWQGRFKAFPIQHDTHLLTVIRYVERNPLRANLVTNAIDWAWSSLGLSAEARRAALEDIAPEAVDERWIQTVNAPQTQSELEAIRTCSARNRPFGDPDWQQKTAARLGLQSSLRRCGRPYKKASAS